MTDVRHAIAFGNEELETLAVELTCGVLGSVAGLIVGEQDSPRLINDERGVLHLRYDTFQVARDCVDRRRSISQTCATLDPAGRAREYVDTHLLLKPQAGGDETDRDLVLASSAELLGTASQHDPWRLVPWRGNRMVSSSSR